MSIIVCLVLFLGMTGHSSATYCICKDGSDQVLQKTLDYACGAGADCTPIIQNGACYNPNTVKDHCNYAVNSYFQRKGQASGSCDFAGTAIQSQTAPTSASGCVFPSSPSNAGTSTTTPTTTPSTTPSTTTTPSTNTTPSTTTTPTTTTNPSTTTPSSTTPVFGSTTGISPTGSGSITDASDGVVLHKNTVLFSRALTLWFSGLMLLWG